jgi:hypothetical protein
MDPAEEARKNKNCCCGCLVGAAVILLLAVVGGKFLPERYDPAFEESFDAGYIDGMVVGNADNREGRVKTEDARLRIARSLGSGQPNPLAYEKAWLGGYEQALRLRLKLPPDWHRDPQYRRFLPEKKEPPKGASQ